LCGVLLLIWEDVGFDLLLSLLSQAKATQPVCYVIAFNVDGTLKDVTKRYSPKFSQVTAKQRVSADWWNKSLKPFAPKHSAKEVAEDSEMNLVELDRPMPKNVGE